MLHFKQRKSNCRLINLNLRKEMQGQGEQRLAADLGVEVNLPKTVLDDLCVDKGLPWAELLWDKEGAVRQNGLKKLQFDLKLPDHVALVVCGAYEMRFEGARICKFEAVPTEGARVDLSYTIQVYPPEEFLAPLSAAIMGTINVKIAPMQADVTERQEETAEAE